ncbi:MAG: 5-oxoprolinase subunit PxpA [Chloroflexi bacterium]|nr:5-oxoprolinase subunit PxpA [Chloroflexota bacterium]
MERAIDLSADCGESFGSYKTGNDDALLPLLTSAHIACGFHASDPMVMDRTVRMCKELGLGIGAHPGFRDLVGFGRRVIEMTREEVEHDVVYQIGALNAFCKRHGVTLGHVKPHGALYNTAAVNAEVAAGIAQGIASLEMDLIVVCQPGTAMDKRAREHGLRVAREGFMDRKYNPDGTLASRRIPGTVYDDPKVAAEQAMRMVTESKVRAMDGTDVPLEVETVCVHSDTPRSVEFARELRKLLDAGGVRYRKLTELVPAVRPR